MQIELENDSKKSGISKKRASNLRGNSLIISPQLFDFIQEFNLPVIPGPDTEQGAVALKFRIKVINSIDRYLAEISRKEVLQPLKTPGHYILAGDPGENIITESLLYSMEMSYPEEYRAATKPAYKLNAVLRSFFERRGCDLLSVTMGFITAGDKIFIDGRFRYEDILIYPLARDKNLSDFIIQGKTENAAHYIKFFNKILE